MIALLLAWAALSLAAYGQTDSYQGAVNGSKGHEISEKAFRHRWWNYYERAVSMVESGFYQEAEADLNIALNKRSHDSRRARTYGMHFVDYFPHRELGILYLQQGKLDAAEHELLASIEQYPSAKASYYLNRVRQEKIRQGGVDITPPAIVLDDDEALRKPTNAFSLDLRGKIVDDQFASGLDIQGEPFRIEQAAPQVAFQQTVNLSDGINIIEMVAWDLAGNKARRQLQIVVDRQAPQLSVDEIRLGEDQQGMRLLTITGKVWDEHPVKEVSIAGYNVVVQPETGAFRSEFHVPADAGSVEFHAEDAIGNQGSGTIEIAKVKPASVAVAQGRPVIVLAAASPLVMSDAQSVWFRLAKSDAAQPPQIQIKDMDKTQEVFWDSVFLEGKAMDDTNVEQVKVNGVPVLRRPGRQVFFSSLLPLKIGGNTIVVQAVDTEGNISEQKLIIVRKQQKVKTLGQRMLVSMLSFEKKGNSGVASEVVEDNLLNALVEQKRFQLVERSRLKEILDEQKLSAMKLVDTATAARIGKIAAASMVIMGSVIETKEGIEVVARVVDTETSEIVATKDVYEENKGLERLRVLMEGLAIKLNHEFPLIQGLLIRRDGKRSITNLGARSGLRRGMRLISFMEGKPILHPVTGKVLGADTEITGELKITEIGDDFDISELLSERKTGSVQPMNAVITR